MNLKKATRGEIVEIIRNSPSHTPHCPTARFGLERCKGKKVMGSYVNFGESYGMLCDFWGKLWKSYAHVNL